MKEGETRETDIQFESMYVTKLQETNTAAWHADYPVFRRFAGLMVGYGIV